MKWGGNKVVVTTGQRATHADPNQTEAFETLFLPSSGRIYPQNGVHQRSWSQYVLDACAVLHCPCIYSIFVRLLLGEPYCLAVKVAVHVKPQTIVHEDGAAECLDVF